MLNMGGPSTVCFFALRLATPPSAVSSIIPASETYSFLRNLFSDGDIIPLPFQSILAPWIAKRRTPRIESSTWTLVAVLLFYAGPNYRGIGGRPGSVTRRTSPKDSASQELRCIPLCASPGRRRDRKTYERGRREMCSCFYTISPIQL
jgi:hypothetical protein